MAPFMPSLVTARSSSSAAAFGSFEGSAAKAAKRFGIGGAGRREPVVDAANQRGRAFGRQLLRRRRAVRDHLHVDAGLVHLLEAQRAEIEQPVHLRSGPAGFQPDVGLGQLGVPVMLLDRDDRAIRLLEHFTPLRKIEVVSYQGRAGVSRCETARHARANRHNPGKTAIREQRMHAFNIDKEQEWDPKKHVEKILAELDVGGGQAGDYTVACWEPGQVSPNHCHPYATEIYFCFSGGGKMRLPSRPSTWCRARSASIRRARCTNTSTGRSARCCSGCATAPTCCRAMSSGRSNPDFKQSAEDAEYYRNNPPR